MPAGIHRAGVLFNHIVELVVPWFYFAPQPAASIAAVLTIVFQLVLIVSGNLSWLNWLTVVLCIPLIDDRWWSWLPVTPVPVDPIHPIYRGIVYVAVGFVALMSVRPALNMLFEWLALGAAYFLFRQLVATPLAARAVTAAAVGAGAVLAAYALYQYAWELPQTRAAYRQDPEATLLEAGISAPPLL